MPKQDSRRGLIRQNSPYPRLPHFFGVIRVQKVILKNAPTAYKIPLAKVSGIFFGYGFRACLLS
jgi:hypothetical protein